MMRFLLILALFIGLLSSFGLNTKERNDLSEQQKQQAMYDTGERSTLPVKNSGEMRSPVLLEYNLEGPAFFERISTENIRRGLAVVLDGVVLSTQSIQEKISGWRFIASGNFMMEETQQSASFLTASSPAPCLSILERELIAPAAGKGVGS